MILVLNKDLFTNNEYTVAYGTRQATFTIVDETLTSSLVGQKKIDSIVCTVRLYASDGSVDKDVIGSLVVGIGDAYVLATSAKKALRGHPMTQDNMADCTVELYEE